MQFSPRFYESPLPPRQGTGDQLHRIDAENTNFLLIICMKVCDVVLRIHLCEHANDDPEESA